MERTNVSQKASAIIGNALLQDLGLISVNNTEMVITRSKIQREQKAWHEFILKKNRMIMQLNRFILTEEKTKLVY